MPVHLSYDMSLLKSGHPVAWVNIKAHHFVSCYPRSVVLTLGPCAGAAAAGADSAEPVAPEGATGGAVPRAGARCHGRGRAADRQSPRALLTLQLTQSFVRPRRAAARAAITSAPRAMVAVAHKLILPNTCLRCRIRGRQPAQKSGTASAAATSRASARAAAAPAAAAQQQRRTARGRRPSPWIRVQQRARIMLQGRQGRSRSRHRLLRRRRLSSSSQRQPRQALAQGSQCRSRMRLCMSAAGHSAGVQTAMPIVKVGHTAVTHQVTLSIAVAYQWCLTARSEGPCKRSAPASRRSTTRESSSISHQQMHHVIGQWSEGPASSIGLPPASTDTASRGPHRIKACISACVDSIRIRRRHTAYRLLIDRYLEKLKRPLLR